MCNKNIQKDIKLYTKMLIVIISRSKALLVVSVSSFFKYVHSLNLSMVKMYYSVKKEREFKTRIGKTYQDLLHFYLGEKSQDMDQKVDKPGQNIFCVHSITVSRAK